MENVLKDEIKETIELLSAAKKKLSKHVMKDKRIELAMRSLLGPMGTLKSLLDD